MHFGRMCRSCGSLCTFSAYAGDGADDGFITDYLLNETFFIDTQVNYNYNLLI